ncbi:defensin-like protein 1 [Carica papaya]|uniref:defensin-like protein 1 n=1 Tax=Carica papaya TaxID=3649 RepID=UPI000B8CB5B8|nr:defensin-like protein 1 [Carica papaya]
MARNSPGLLLFLLLVLASQEEMMTEGRTCQSQSHGFHGACLSHHNCAVVCQKEGFSGGKCRGFRRRCFCTRLC